MSSPAVPQHHQPWLQSHNLLQDLQKHKKHPASVSLHTGSQYSSTGRCAPNCGYRYTSSHMRHEQKHCPALAIFIVTVGLRLDRINYLGAAGLLFWQRRYRSAGTPWETRYGYSRVVVAGGLVFVSGTVTADHTGRISAPECRLEMELDAVLPPAPA